LPNPIHSGVIPLNSGPLRSCSTPYLSERKDTMTEEKIPEEDKRRILCPEYGIEKRKPW